VTQQLERATAVVEWAEELKVERRFAEAGAALAAAWRVLGIEPRSLHGKDPRQLHRVVGSGEQLRGVTALLVAEADLLEREGDKDSASAMARWTLSALLHGASPGDYSELMRRLLSLACTSAA
jgi:hypothetical protein